MESPQLCGFFISTQNYTYCIQVHLGGSRANKLVVKVQLPHYQFCPEIEILIDN